MINPNNKEPVEPKLFNGNPNYGTLDLNDSEIERLNKSIETKASNLEYLKQNYPSPIPNHKYLVKGIESRPDSIPNQSKPIVDSVIEAVNHPSHYNQGDIEAIDAIAATGFADGFCLGNCMKYLWRYKHKNGEEDLAKAQFYLNWYIDYLQRSKTNK